MTANLRIHARRAQRWTVAVVGAVSFPHAESSALASAG
jgi:hypothetical protein